YAKAGFLLKAIAVCKVVLQLDPKHTATQTMLASLYAQRDGRPAPQATNLVRTQSGNFTILPPAPPAPMAAPSPPPPQVEADPPQLVALDEIEIPIEIPVGAPIEVLPLASVLEARKSGQFTIVLPEDGTPEIRPESSAYEITLDDIEEVPSLDPMALRVV